MNKADRQIHSMGKARETLHSDQVRNRDVLGPDAALRTSGNGLSGSAGAGREPLMRPLAVLNAIIFGSAAAITFGLLGVVVIFLVLKGSNPALGDEFPALLRNSAVFTGAGGGVRREPAGVAQDPEMALAGAGGDVGRDWRASPCCTGRNEADHAARVSRPVRICPRILRGKIP